MKPAVRKRSNAPIFWALFGAGGMLAALVGPALVLVTGVLAPLGIGFPEGYMSYERSLAFAQHWLGKAFLFAVVMLFAWHAAHRIKVSLHDIGIPAGTGAKLVCYGLAFAVTVVAGWSLLAIGF
jgi:fumarate reductase subunit D